MELRKKCVCTASRAGQAVREHALADQEQNRHCSYVTGEFVDCLTTLYEMWSFLDTKGIMGSPLLSGNQTS